jgi:CubicO group peptidase (beta-lactamase class C family)
LSQVAIEGHCDARFQAVRELFTREFATGAALGAAVCFTWHGEPVVDLWGGFCDRERTRPWSADTLVNVFSATKAMTALCAHQLLERGLLDLDAPVARYWPEFAAAGKHSLPVRHLLDHRAGLPALRRPLPEAALYDWLQMTQALAEQAPWWEPGARHGYHALTFGFLVGELVRRVAGCSLGRWFREHVARPLAAEFHIGLAAEQQARVSPVYGRQVVPDASAGLRLRGPQAEFLRALADPTSLTAAAFCNPPLSTQAVNSAAWRRAEIPSANGHATARGIARIYAALACGGALDAVRILEPESIARATAEQAIGPDAILVGLEMRYGLGFLLPHAQLRFGPGQRAFGHPGAGGSLGLADPERRVGFGYTLNRLRPRLFGADVAHAMLRAFFAAL